MPTVTNSPLPIASPADDDESSTANLHVVAGVSESDVGQARIAKSRSFVAATVLLCKKKQVASFLRCHLERNIPMCVTNSPAAVVAPIEHSASGAAAAAGTL